MSYYTATSHSLQNLSNLLRDFDTFTLSAATSRALSGHPTYDKESKSYVYEVSLPGYTKEEVSIQIEDSVLTVTADSKTRGKASLDLTLDEIDEGKVSANLEHGILRISLPQTPKPAAKRVLIS